VPDVKRRFLNMKRLARAKFFIVIKKELKRILVFKKEKSINVRNVVSLSDWIREEELK
jgi:hypothetical protein